MARTSFSLIRSNKNYSRSLEADWINFFCYVYATRTKRVRRNGYNCNPEMDLLHVWYNHLFEHGYTQIAWSWFYAIIVGDKGAREVVERDKEKTKRESRWSRRYNDKNWKKRYDGHRYRRDPSHAKKSKEKSPRQLWREHKQFNRDSNRWKWHSGARCKQDSKRCSHRQYRAYARRMIETEKTELMSSGNEDYNALCDKRDWAW